MKITAKTASMPTVTPREMANAIRALAMDAVETAKSGHPGMPMGMADVATTLFRDVLKFDPSDPAWPDRDRFVLSAGHGSMLIYALLHLTGYEGVTIDELKKFRQLGAKTAGHPEYGHCPGVETTTGPLGQGIATAVGMAIAEAMLAERFGRDLVDHHTYVIAGDGCLMEGISHEAIDLAGHLKLGRLVVLWDDNRISIDGPTSLSTSTDQMKRFEAAGWHVQAIDGHDHAAISSALAAAKAVTDKPSMIACHTLIGYGAPNKQGSEATHGAPLGADEIAAARKHLSWPHAPFEIPAPVRSAWLAAGERGAAARAAWTSRRDASPAKAAFDAHMRGEAGPALDAALLAYKKELATGAPKIATRKASEMVLGVVNGATSLTVGGSADLTHSNLTVTKGLEKVAPGKLGGRYIHYGIREHGMAAAMNGIALHGGFIPYGGTFLVFSDYARGAMRLSALMQQRVIYVMTHDSIGLGEDGPTHQPVEHLAMLRATPNLNVFRPADAVETAECWQIALSTRETPSVLALSRQNLPTLRTSPTDDNPCSRGGYVLREAFDGKRDVTLVATGSEVEIAVAAADILQRDGNVSAAVVSLPCWELFGQQSAEYRRSVLGSAPRIGIEAACGFGWERWLGDAGRFIGLGTFGASAPAPALYRYFGITAEEVAAAARTMLH